MFKNRGSSFQLGERLKWLKNHFSHTSDVIYHDFVAGPGVACALVHLKGMVDLAAIEQSVLKVISSMDPSMSQREFAERLLDHKELPIQQQSVKETMEDAAKGVLDGQALLLIDRERRLLALTVASFEKRSIQEAPNESVIRGPREAFIEDLDTNITLMRRRLKSELLKTELYHIGERTETAVALLYLEDVCSPQLLDEMKRRLKNIDVDGVLGSSYLEEMIDDNPYSPFPQMQYTERPDVVAASLLEGRIAVFVNGTPIVILAPVTMFMLIQSAEDYYQRYTSSSWLRIIRYFFLFASLLMPSIYIAVTTFHADMIPERLLMTIAASREVVPFPALVEAFIMELSFEALREATLRIPKAIGQSVSIIGALIIGTAAVDAGIVSAAMVIIVSLTGISSYIIPHFDLSLAFRLLRFPFMILAGIFGLFGIVCGMILIYLHLLELRSFGVPYLAPFAPVHLKDIKDSVVRAPWWAMITRPSFFGLPGRRRMASRKWMQARGKDGGNQG
ncbi:spore germination protein [Cohnella pontilimi]|uniref:Spore germination protein n=1 Tax=Cohnella pontilimi TaxID=2564100 RepID=A0A4U0FAV3_9BACL|nr:spore germination protein [Cohnella pontilimi]TJY41810.1 spore germination protein [Cohnella pontilimi]